MVLARPAFSDTSTPPSESDESQPESKTLVVPAVFYTPETGMGAGIGLVWSIDNKNPETRPTTILPLAVYTENQQSILKLFLDSYPENGQWYLQGELAYINYPDRFYGTGPDTAEESFESFREVMKSATFHPHYLVAHNLYAGPSFYVESAGVEDKEPTRSLAQAEVAGAGGGIVGGSGVRLLYNSRDNLFTPTRGARYLASWMHHSKSTGSEFEYNQSIVRIRQYFSLAKATVLALETNLTGTNGDVPFRRMALLGGQNQLRGYFLGRYRDKWAWSAQSGLRQYWGRYGAVLFWGVGAVEESWQKLRTVKPRRAWGAGLRYIVVEKTKAGFRLDYASGHDSSAIYFGVSEAF